MSVLYKQILGKQDDPIRTEICSQAKGNEIKLCQLLLITEGSLVNKRDLLALYLSGTYCHKTGIRPPSCVT